MTKLILSICVSILWFNGVSDKVYDTLGANSETNTRDLISDINKLKPTSQLNAYRGTLEMQLASFVSGAKNKLDKFKEGNKILEAEISSHPTNAEYRFLRLSIQENAPRILKYYKNIEEDKVMITDAYPTLPTQLKSVIKEYSKTSKALDLKDFE